MLHSTVCYKVWATRLQNKQESIPVCLRWLLFLPLRRPKAGSCSSSLGMLAGASQQIRLHSPWIYTLLLLSEADSADAQLPQCLEEYQLSSAQHKETESLHVSRRNIYFSVQNPSPLLFPMHYQSNCLGFICHSKALHAQEQHTPFPIFCLQNDWGTRTCP